MYLEFYEYTGEFYSMYVPPAAMNMTGSEIPANPSMCVWMIFHCRVWLAEGKEIAATKMMNTWKFLEFHGRIIKFTMDRTNMNK